MINNFSVLHFFYISKTRIHKGEWAATLLSNPIRNTITILIRIRIRIRISYSKSLLLFSIDLINLQLFFSKFRLVKTWRIFFSYKYEIE
jgi:hypothetical protein